MKFFALFAALPGPLVAAFSFNAYDLGFNGLYPRQSFKSVNLRPPSPKVTKWDSRCDTGNHLLLTPRGPLVSGKARGPVILDSKGNLVWMDNDKFEQAMNLNVQTYKGEDYLTFWWKNKKRPKGSKLPKKSFVMVGSTVSLVILSNTVLTFLQLNSSYDIVHTITPHGKGKKADSHEFRITPQGTALIIIYLKHQVDCTQLGLGKKCWIQDGLFQEIDIKTGKLLFEWQATKHISMKDVYSSPSRKDGHGKSKKDAFDFFHLNSVDKIDSGDYIISARYMHAVACISAKTGEILWQLGGKNNSFKNLDSATDFSWQHHVTWQGNGTVSLFDNHANNVFHSPSKFSKGMIIQLDTNNMTASLVQKYPHPNKILNVSQGSVQVIPDSGNVLVGFGNSPTYVEYTAGGEVLCSAHFGPHLIYEIIDFGLVKSYRIFKSPWKGRPNTKPDVKIKNGKAYVSWNGATEVTRWRLETAKSSKAQDDEFVTVQELQRTGFETSFALDKVKSHVRIVALSGKKGRKDMATSAVVRSSSSSVCSILSPSCRTSAHLAQVSVWLILMIITFSISILTLAWFAVTKRKIHRLSRLSQFPVLSKLHWYKSKPNKQQFGSELDPLLFDDDVIDEEHVTQ